MALTLHNSSSVPATVAIDFREQPSFALSIAKEEWSADGYKRCPLRADGDTSPSASRGSRVGR